MRTLASMFILLLGIACLTVKSRLPPRRRRFVPKEYVRHFEDIRLFSTITGVFLFQLGMVVPFRYVTLPAKEAGFSPDLIPYLLPIFSAINVFGRIFLSVAADKIGGFNVVTTITFVSAAFCLTAPALVESMADIIVYVVIFGFFSGGVISLVPTLVAQISDIRHIGTRVGSAFAIQATGALIGSPIVCYFKITALQPSRPAVIVWLFYIARVRWIRLGEIYAGWLQVGQGLI